MPVAGGYVPPDLDLAAFHRPNCGAYAQQLWSFLEGEIPSRSRKQWRLSYCTHCYEIAIWREKAMVYPSGGNAPPPSPDLPADIQADYEEARAILNRSPRGAAALLRLAIQKLCKHVGEKGENPNDDIASLVKKGLLPTVQQALDAVRVIGNNAVHPGQIDLEDQPEMATALFQLVNLIAEQMITAPAQAAAVFNSLPASALAQIGKRDGTST